MRTTAGILVASVVTLLALAASPAEAQVASALIQEDAELPGSSGAIISGINNTGVNGVGGYAFTVTTDGSVSRVWGAANGGAGTLLRSEGVVGPLTQTSFESFFGYSDAGEICYSASSDESGGSTGLDGVWIDDTVILNEEDPITALPGQFSTFNSRPGITRGGAPYWIGGYSDTQGGSTQARAIFYGNSATVLITDGDTITGVAEPVGSGSAIDFDVRLTDAGGVVHWIDLISVDAATSMDGVVVIDGAALFVEGLVTREGSPVPEKAGGLPAENWDNFDFFGITPDGTYLVTGDTDGDTSMDEFVLTDDVIVLREGAMLVRDGSMFTISGSIEGGYMNHDADWAVIWDVDDESDVNLEALILNGELLLIEGDAVDWNNDGVIDGGDNGAVIENFTGITALTLSDRAPDNIVNIYFTADVGVGGATLEGAFCLPIQVAPVVESCGEGGVDAGCGFPTDVLFVNGLSGNEDRIIDTFDQSTALSFQITEAPSRSGDKESSGACIYVWSGAPEAGDIVAVPKELGSMCFGPLELATQTPLRTFNGLGFVGRLGPHDSPFPPPVIPAGEILEFASRPAGTGQPMTVTLQGFVEDNCSQGTQPYSVTNGITLIIP